MSTRLARSAGLIGAATMTSRVLGVARETVLAALFGAGNEMDAFNVAFRIPNLLRDLFAEGAMSAAFVATFTRTLTTRGRDAAWRLGNLVMNALFALTVAAVAIAWVFAPPLVRLLAPDYARVPGKLHLTIVLTRIMLPFIPMVALSVVMMGMLNSLRRFFIPALSPATFNVATILAAFAIVPAMPQLGWPRIAGIAIGTLLGGLGQILLQSPILRREGWRYAPALDVRDAGVREVLLLMAPGTIGLAAVQFNVFVNTILATGQGTGAVSWLNYAFRIMYLPIGLFGASIGTAALPDIARHAATEDLAALKRTVSSAMRLMLMLNIPATVGLVLLAEPIVAMLLERGHFGRTDTMATAAALTWYAPGLIGYSTVKIASPSFYSLRDSRTPVIASAIAVVINIVLNLALVHVLGFRGLALGTSVAAIVNAGLLLIWLRRRLGGLDARENTRAIGSIALASAVMGVVVWLTERALDAMLPGVSTLARAVRVFTSIGAGIVALTIAARLLHIEEFRHALGRVTSRFAGGPPNE